MNVSKKTHRILPALSLMIASFAVSQLNADFTMVSRLSELSVNTVNLGGNNHYDAFSDLTAPYHNQIAGSGTFQGPGGALNFGAWAVSQRSNIFARSMQSNNHAYGRTEQIEGNGVVSINDFSRFVAEFEVDSVMDFRLGGFVDGNVQEVSADDFVRVQLQWWNGSAYINMFSTTAGDDISQGYEDTFVPGTQYRFAVLATARTFGNEENSSQAFAFIKAVPEPSAALLSAGGLGFLFIRRSRVSARRGNSTNAA